MIIVVLACLLIAEIGIVAIMINRFEREQTRLRHLFRNEMQGLISGMEDRLESRIERLENVSIGFRQHREGHHRDRSE
jgi:hypothetical protein